MDHPRVTKSMQLILRALMDGPEQGMCGLEICSAAGLPTGTIHRPLARLVAWGWLQSEWEQYDPAEHGRPRQRCFHIDPDGMHAVQAALHRAEAPPSQPVGLRPGLTG